MKQTIDMKFKINNRSQNLTILHLLCDCEGGHIRSKLHKKLAKLNKSMKVFALNLKSKKTARFQATSPVISELQRQSSVVRCFDRDDVSAEVGAEQQRQRSDHARALWFPARQRQLGEMLVRTQHDEVGAEHNPRIEAG